MGSVHKNEIEPGGKLAHSKFDQGNDTQSESTTNYGSENEASDSFLKKIVQATENQVTKSSDDSCVSPPSAGSRHFNPSYETSTDPEAPVQYRSNSFRPRLQTQPTTAVSLATTFGQHISDSAHDGDSFSGVRLRSGLSLEQTGNIHGGSGKTSRTGEDSSSVRSYIPSLKAPKDVESSLGGILSSERGLPTWESLNAQASGQTASLVEFEEGKDWKAQFEAELEEVLQGGEETVDEGDLQSWKSRLKHFFILSAAGKPIFSRYGDDSLILEYIGVIQTIISSFQQGDNAIKGFNAGSTRFVLVAEGPLYLVAISRLDESDSQLRAQLGALYTQVLSTLTLPTLTSLFSNRPSTDLRRPLQGTEPLLVALADSFTRGSPSTLLSALECLKLEYVQRQSINSILLRARVPSLLYGLVVAGGRLVSVIRPRKHSLHPSDLHLIFNMIYAAGGIKASSGENWVPLCLPAFNNRGYLYMYTSFLEVEASSANEPGPDHIAVILISTERESFYELKGMRDDVVQQFGKQGIIEMINSAVREGRFKADQIAPGTPIRHFLYKSRRNVQFIRSSFSPDFSSPLAQRQLHANVHAKHNHLRVHYRVRTGCVSLAWITPVFELYCVGALPPSTTTNRGVVSGIAEPTTTTATIKATLAEAAQRVCQWVGREEQRLFIIGGAVF